MTNSGQRIATSTGVMLADPRQLANPLLKAPESLFDPIFWEARGELELVYGGRGAAWFVGAAADQWVLRHYRRGGFIAFLCQDRYVWTGEPNVRAFAEWRLLAHLSQSGLPVPRPIAAWYRRTAYSYRCDLITQRVADAQPLSALLLSAALAQSSWRAIGVAIARLHRAGVDHADLNAHNILLDSQAAISVIDFDRGRLRAPGAWSRANLARLRRSLEKICASLPPDRFARPAWDSFLAGYHAD
jgi:3-deoxy-D-manno-octulosonic acid kinase